VNSHAISLSHPATVSNQARIHTGKGPGGENPHAIGASHQLKVSKQANTETWDLAGRIHTLSNQAIEPRLANKLAKR
jgi:hypothetical protein